MIEFLEERLEFLDRRTSKETGKDYFILHWKDNMGELRTAMGDLVADAIHNAKQDLAEQRGRP